MEKYVVGTVIRPHGVRGAVKIDPLTDDILRFKKLKKVFIQDKEYEVISAQVSKSEVYLTLSNILDRDMAELLRGKQVFVSKEDAIKPKEGRYFIVDLIGCAIYVEDNCLGTLEDILQHGSADVYVVRLQNKKTAMFPALKKLIENVDVQAKQIKLNGKVFEEVVVYED